MSNVGLDEGQGDLSYTTNERTVQDRMELSSQIKDRHIPYPSNFTLQLCTLEKLMLICTRIRGEECS